MLTLASTVISMFQWTIYGTETTIDSLRQDMPQRSTLARLHPHLRGIGPRPGPASCHRRRCLRFRSKGITITAIPVDHIVETVAYIIEDDQSACVIVTDTGPTDRVWDRCHQLQGLTTVVLECALPRSIAVARGCVEAPDSDHIQGGPGQGTGSRSVTFFSRSISSRISTTRSSRSWQHCRYLASR